MNSIQENNFIPKKERKDISVSIIRLLSIFSIVICHILQYYDNNLCWWFNAAVAVFLIISGFLYGKRRYEFESCKSFINFSISFYIHEYLKLAIDFYLMLVVILPIAFYQNNAVWKDVFRLLLFRPATVPGFGYMWYFSEIWICYFITPLLYLTVKKFSNYFLIFVFIILEIIGIKYISVLWLLCYICGFIISSNIKQFVKNLILFCFIGIILTIICIIFSVDRTIDSFLLMNQKVYFGITIFLILKLLCNRMSINNVYISKILNLMDRISYDIFLIHPMFLSGVVCVMTVTTNKVLSVCVLFCLVFISALLLSFISRKIRGIVWKK